ncbi:uncharacterized protein F5Z01DRAFT_228099 [Emericellopsis atlantica]|uniref:Zn(2)-C6 fungal-type domain-containing protein n=1 Tax=Emericellopsis atlantica TaxID=2614577 RepID=A0A9P7ZJ56_9HYPO|nr:uncharacterized protein F5Z01DRAFT_228099 [Emericellopsis atlantica]KAG9252438.1 hypothetical protein F5Z01DRAFT_228099 [Emericellopsis atlantica]
MRHLPRRIKCDELRPACARCVRSGWKCDGYPSTTPSSAARAALSRSGPSLDISAYSIPFQVPGSKRDRELFHYFCTQAASDLSGFVSSQFWTKTVLQTSHHEPLVRQVLLALSSLHLDYISSDTLDSQIASTFTMEQYGKAIRNLQKRIRNSPSPDVVRIVSICSILLYSFESMLGNSQSALSQLEGGLSLLKSIQANNYRELPESEDIVDIFARLDIQATMFDDSHLPTLVLTTSQERQAMTVETSNIPFDTTEAAQRELIKLQNWLFHLLISNVWCKEMPIDCVPPDVLLEKDLLDQKLRLWYDKSTALLSRSQAAARGPNAGLSILLIHYHVSRMLLASSLPENRAVFGSSPNAQAKEVVEMAESILHYAQQNNSNATTARNPRRNFSAEAGVIAPLALLVFKCADPSIVQRATRVLGLLQRQEGLYDTRSLLSAAQQLNEYKDKRQLDPQAVLEDAPLPLEYSVLDVAEGAQALMEANYKLVPPTFLPVPELV